MSTTNTATVEVLARTNPRSLKESLAAQDWSLIRMSDGNPPAADEVELIMRAGPEDFRAAADFMQRNAELELAREEKRKQMVDLIVRYSRYPGETTESIVERMNPADRAEFFDLSGAFL